MVTTQGQTKSLKYLKNIKPHHGSRPPLARAVRSSCNAGRLQPLKPRKFEKRRLPTCRIVYAAAGPQRGLRGATPPAATRGVRETAPPRYPNIYLLLVVFCTAIETLQIHLTKKHKRTNTHVLVKQQNKAKRKRAYYSQTDLTERSGHMLIAVSH